MRTSNIIDVQEFDDLVIKTYGRPYSFQQQDGCKNRGIAEFTIPTDEEDYENTEIPEIENGDEMGVSFAAWLAKDPNFKLPGSNYRSTIWWNRSFYPHVSMILNDLNKKGLIPSGDLVISINW